MFARGPWILSALLLAGCETLIGIPEHPLYGDEAQGDSAVDGGTLPLDAGSDSSSEPAVDSAALDAREDATVAADSASDTSTDSATDTSADGDAAVEGGVDALGDGPIADSSVFACARDADCPSGQTCQTSFNTAMLRWDLVCALPRAGALKSYGESCLNEKDCRGGACVNLGSGNKLCAALCADAADCVSPLPSCGIVNLGLPGGAGSQALSLCKP